MIRDEFLKQEKNKVTKKEMSQIRKLGERGFYSSYISKKKDFLKAGNFSAAFSLVISLISLVLIILIFVAGSAKMEWTFVLFIILTVGLVGWGLTFYCVLKPLYNKRIDKYKKCLEELNNKEMEKQQSIYNFYKNKENKQ